MGSEQGENNEKPQRLIYLDAFQMDRTPVTNAEYAEFLEWMERTHDHSRCFPGEPEGKDHIPAHWSERKWNAPRQPVVGVDWYDAYAYAAWAGKRLPTEAEWEKAARGTDGRTYPWGDEWADARANASDSGQGVTLEVDSFPRSQSPYGCLNMAGNAWEWCADWYSETTYSVSPSRNPQGPEIGRYRVLRGGSWFNLPKDCRSTSRLRLEPFSRSSEVGFRCAESL